MIYGLCGVIMQTLLSIFGLYKIKTADAVLDLSMFIGVVSYALSFGLWILLLRRFPISIIFPLALSFNLVMTQIFSVVVLHEPWNYWQVAAIALILSGIALLYIGSQKL